MEKHEIVQVAKNLLAQPGRAFVMGTVSPEGRPHIFYMGAAVFEEPFTLYLETFSDSRKVTHLKKNPNVEIVLAQADFSQVATLAGTATMEESGAKRQQVWDSIPASGEYFRGPDSPDFGVIKVTVKNIQVQVMSGNPREVFVANL